MDKLKLSIILAICRSRKLESGLNKEEMLEILGQYSQDELTYASNYVQFSKTEVIERLLQQYDNYEDKNLLKYLESINYVSFPIPMTYLGTNRRNIIITFFYLNKLQCNLPQRNFTPEQIKSIQSNGVTIINAGPGTGKTTTACAKAYYLSSNGRNVLFESYTNSAVREDKVRMLEYPIDSDRITFTTIDSFAGKICGGISNSYDQNIRDAIEKIENGFHPKNCNFDDLIIDEAQDIDDLRFELMIKMYIKGFFKTLTIYGDPRQRMKSSAGEWYRKMWVESGENEIKNGVSSYSIYFTSLPITRIGFTYSQRFFNQQLVDLTNEVSKTRPDIHYKLESSNIQFSEKPILVLNGNILEEILEFIKDKISKGDRYSDFMVISPCIDGDNKTSKNAQAVSSFLRYQGIPCKLESQGSYHSNGVLFSTIHSSKGKQAKYVILLGMNNYNNVFSMIPMDESDSLTFIAHSRARCLNIYAMTTSDITLPKGIPRTFLDERKSNIGLVREYTFEESKIDCKFNISSLCSDHDFMKFIDSNYFTTSREQIQFPFLQMPERDEPPDFYGIMTGMALAIFSQMKLPDIITKYFNGNFRVIDDKEYEKLKREDINFIDGIFVSDEIRTVIIKKSEFQEMEDLKYLQNKFIGSYTIEEFYKLTVLLVKISWGYKIFHNSIHNPNLIEFWKMTSKNINDCFGEVIASEVKVKFDHTVGSIDLLTETCIIEIKTKKDDDKSDGLQTHLYKVCMDSNKHCIVVNVNKRECYRVTSNRNNESWKYLLSKFSQIFISQLVVNNRVRKIPRKTFFKQQNIFCVDTEFNPIIVDNKAMGIFEIAIYNCNDPYRSVVTIVNNGQFNKESAISWLDITPSLYDDSPNIGTVTELFKRVIKLYEDKPILYHYIATNDISWISCTGHLSVNTFDLSKVLICDGFFESQIKKPKLVDYFNSKIDFIDCRKELKHHTAISDTIMLYEILMYL